MVLPLGVYPPGTDLSAFRIFDPSSGESVSGSGYIVSQLSLNRAQLNDSETEQDDPGASTPEPGFYQVVRDGVYIVGVSNLTSGPVSDTIALSFEAGNAIGTLLQVNLLVDGVPCRGGKNLAGPPFYPGQVSLDTGFLENGDHWIQLEAGWSNPDTGDLNNFMIRRVSDGFTLSVSNVIYYPEWEEEIGELGVTAYLAKTTCINADWRIDIYDAGSNFVQTLTGHTSDGTFRRTGTWLTRTASHAPT